MKIWEILKEENIGKYVSISNTDEIINPSYVDKYIIGKNGNDRIGIFAKTEKGFYYVEEIRSSDILIMDFEFIES